MLNAPFLRNFIISKYFFFNNLDFWQFNQRKSNVLWFNPFSIDSFFHFFFLSVNFAFIVQYNDMSYCQLILILYHWINASLLEICACTKGLYDVDASWSGILMMLQKTNKVCLYRKIQQAYSGLEIMMNWCRSHYWL